MSLNAAAAEFTPAFATVTITGSTSASGVTGALPTGVYTSVLVANEGSATAFVVLGGASVVATTTTGVPVLSGTKMVIRLSLTSADTSTPVATTAAVITNTGTAKVYISAGDGGVSA